MTPPPRPTAAPPPTAPPHERLTDLSDMAGHLIRRLHQTSTGVFLNRSRAAGIDLTPVQFAAMSAIGQEPGMDQATVAARIGYDRATIGGVIDRLEHKGWVTRTTSKRDRRAREVSLTDTGTALLAQALPVVRALQTDILPGLTQAEQRLFLDLARRVIAAQDT